MPDLLSLPPDTGPHRPAPPRWVRKGGGSAADAFAAGAVLAWIDPLVRDTGPLAQLWRRRLALGAAAAVARLQGRREGAAQLRDQWFLCRAGDDPGPAGRLLGGWRQLGERRALQPDLWPGRLPALFELPADKDLHHLLADLAARSVNTALSLPDATAAVGRILRLGPQQRGLAFWLADALLARHLGWDRAVPLLAAHLPRAALGLVPASDSAGQGWHLACLAAWARAALAAVDLHADLTRRADRLTLVAPRLRGRDAGDVVAQLLREDAVAAQAGVAASDRAARRLFDRLTRLGVVRELTGRPNFRLYGL